MTLQAVTDRIGEFAAGAWRMILSVNNFWSALFATAAGAYIAFELERRRRKRERISSECAKANAIIATLGRMLTILDNLQATLPPLKNGKPTADSYKPITSIPGNMPAIDFAALEFLLETNDPNDQCARAYGRIAHAQAQFDSALTQFSERNLLAQHYQESSLILQRGEEAVGPRLKADALYGELSYFAVELNAGLPARVKLFKEVVAQLRTALSARYPGRQFLRLFPEDPKAAPV